MKGDAVIVIKGDLKNLKGSVEKVEDSTVHVQPKLAGLPVVTRRLTYYYKDDLITIFDQYLRRILSFIITENTCLQ